jgi:drug/metabolite transporter (DMT)-like permease
MQLFFSEQLLSLTPAIAATPSTMKHPTAVRPWQGIACLMAAVACFSVLDTTAKYVSATVPVMVAVWFRYLFQAVLVTAVMLPVRGKRLLATAHPRFQLLRGVLLLTVSMLSFWSVSLMPVGEFTAIVMLAPLAVTLLAAVFLKERVSPLRWALVSGGFAGALLIVRPGGQLSGWVTLLPLLMVVVYAGFQILTSRLARTEDPMTMHFYTGWVGAVAMCAVVPWVWTGVPDLATLARLCLVGLMGTVGHFLLILAYGRAPASTLSPYLYSQIGFAMLAGWVVFDHVPGLLEWMGVGLIAACGASAGWLSARELRKVQH